MALDFIGKVPAKTRIVVAMSGGVDSSTAAALMVEAGYEVIGITLQLYDHGVAIESSRTCCAGRDIYDARRVAESLDIPHYVLDYESQFRQEVIDTFADSYLRGETPVPCVQCNQTVKFRDLLITANDLGADALVTGHYVRRIEGKTGPELYRGVDHSKDQSYFLFATTREQLSYLAFPLGGMSKSETRDHAQRFGLRVAEKPESQDICFIPNGDYGRLLEKLRPGGWEPGDIVDLDGKRLGGHDGIVHFTVGQRRRLGIATGKPLYVIRVEPGTRNVVVGPRQALFRQHFSVGGINWLGEGELGNEGSEILVKIRSTSEPVPATISMGANGRWNVTFTTPAEGTSPGQAAVFYQGERVLGGGWIESD